MAPIPIDDVIAGAVGVGRNSPEGRAFVYFGGTMISNPPASGIILPDLEFRSGDTQEFARFGRALAVGDLNGDLVGDIIFGTPFFDTGPRNALLVDSGDLFFALGRTPLSVKGSHDQETRTRVPRSSMTGVVVLNQAALFRRGVQTRDDH